MPESVYEMRFVISGLIKAAVAGKLASLRRLSVSANALHTRIDL
jgi:hypothetical protein